MTLCDERYISGNPGFEPTVAAYVATEGFDDAGQTHLAGSGIEPNLLAYLERQRVPAVQAYVLSLLNAGW